MHRNAVNMFTTKWYTISENGSKNNTGISFYADVFPFSLKIEMWFVVIGMFVISSLQTNVWAGPTIFIILVQ